MKRKKPYRVIKLVRIINHGKARVYEPGQTVLLTEEQAAGHLEQGRIE